MKRKFRSKEEWDDILARQQASGQTIAEFCKDNNINISSFGNRRARITKSGFTAFKPLPTAGSDIELELPHGIILRITC